MPTAEKTKDRVKINAIITHQRPHIDEIVALWLLKRFGLTKYSGLRSAKLEFRKGDNSDTTTASTVVDLEKQGIIAIGIGNGRFDEHKNGSGVLDNQCAATLVAQYLGVDGNPALRQILRFTLNTDRKGAAQPFDISSITKAMYNQYPDNPMKVVKWALAAISAKYAEQFAFHNQTVEEFAKAKIVEIGFYGRKIRLAIIESDDPQFNKYARSRGIAVIIQRNSSGHTQIFTNKKVAGFRLFDVVKILRQAEQQRRSTPRPVTDWKRLAAEGMLAGWYYQRETETLLNGCLTNTGVEPSILDLDFVRRAVTIGINPKLFHDDCPIAKGQQHCTNRKCPWYCWGLHRCTKARFDILNNQ